jgi:hypothetical protein
MNLITEKLKLHLGKDITDLAFNYFGLVEALWSEQNITAAERNWADFLLGRLTMPLGSDTLQIQPWFIGPGAKLIRRLVYKNFPKDNIHLLPSSGISAHFPLSTFPRKDISDNIYILNSSIDYNIWVSSIAEEIISVTRPYLPNTSQHIPRGLGIFENKSNVPDFLSRHNSSRRVKCFYLATPMSPIVVSDEDVKIYWENARKLYLHMPTAPTAPTSPFWVRHLQGGYN